MCVNSFKVWSMKYYILTLLILVFGCTPKENVSFKHNNKMYYCAYVNYLKLVLENPIISSEDFEFKKEDLNGISPKGDANYYKVVSKNSKKIVYVHSMKTDKLKEMITLNEKGWIESKKIFDNSSKQIKECKWTYIIDDTNTTIHEKCDDNSKVIKYFSDTKEEELMFENNKLVEKLVYDNSTRYRYDANGKLLDEFHIVSEGDMCIPFKPYLMEEKDIK